MTLDNAEDGAPGNPAGKRLDEFADFPRGRGGRPKIIRAERQPDGSWRVPTGVDGKPIHELVPFVRASSLGNAIEFQGGLELWKAAVAVWGVVRSRTLGKRARAIDGYSRPDQKSELYEIVKKAQAFAESDQQANHGTALHSIFQRIAEGETVEQLIAAGALDTDDVPAAQAFADAITRFEVIWCERRVVCDEAQAAGKYDLIVSPRRPMPVTDDAGEVVDVIHPGEMIAVDNKTASSDKFFGEKFTVQLWVYANGRDYDKTTGERTEVGVNKRWALILHIPSGTGVGENGEPTGEPGSATWHWVDLSIGEKLVRVAHDVLEGRKLGKAAITAADLDAEIPAELLAPKVSAEVAREELRQAFATVAGHSVGELMDVPESSTDGAADPPERAELGEALDHGDQQNWVEGVGDVELAREALRGTLEEPVLERLIEQRRPRSTATVQDPPENLARHLQEAEARRKVEDQLITAIRRATTTDGGPDSLMDLYARASAAGYWCARVKAAASNRRAELENML